MASRVTGLPESLKVIEVDYLRDEALLRSDEPTWRGQRRFYYEAHLCGACEATFCRFQAPGAGGQVREQVAFPMTCEALAKLICDLTAE
jgi:hypothetical protein